MLKNVFKPMLAASAAALLLVMSVPTPSQAAQEGRDDETYNAPGARTDWQARDRGGETRIAHGQGGRRDRWRGHQAERRDNWREHRADRRDRRRDYRGYRWNDRQDGWRGNRGKYQNREAKRHAKYRAKERAKYRHRRAERRQEWRQSGWQRGWNRWDRRSAKRRHQDLRGHRRHPHRY